MAKRCNDQVCLKLAGELRASLEAEAAASGRSLSYLIRKILIAHFIQPLTERATGTDAGASH
jgi:predicted DNA-binding protein